MENKLSLSVILPIKSSKTKNFDEFFDKAINSLKEQKVDFEELVIVHTQEETLISFLDNYDFGKLNV
jgi:peptidase E